MKYFLRKRDHEFWLETRSENHCTVIAEQEPDVNELVSKLSIKNCQAIELGCDLDELANEYSEGKSTAEVFKIAHEKDFKAGFQKCLELIGHKKFSEEDMNNTMNWIMNEYFEFHEQPTTARREHYIQSLQQTEWEVEIIMEKYGYCEGCRKAGMWHCAHADTCGNAIELERPKLDKKGCLILKRK